eukprot:scpid41033/ scgid28075/ 
MSVWADPQVELVLRDVRDRMYNDCDILRSDCMSKQLISRSQSVTLRSITNPQIQLEHLISMLAAGSGQSFQIFVEILKEHIVVGQEDIYKRLKDASSQHVGTSTYDQEVYRLAYLESTGGGSPQTSGNIVFDRKKLRLLDTRHQFVTKSSTKGPKQAASAKEPAAKGATGSAGSGDAGSKEESTDDSVCTSSGQSNAPTAEQAAPIPGNRTDGLLAENLEDSGMGDRSKKPIKYVEYDSREDEGKIYMKQRLASRVVILTGNMDALLNDLTSQEIATPRNMAELTTIEHSGIYCLIPSKDEDADTLPIYMILCLLPGDSHLHHAHLLRFALQMSLHVVVYYGYEHLVSNQAFSLQRSTHAAGQPIGPDPLMNVMFRPQRLFEAFSTEDIDILTLLSQVLNEFPAGSQLSLCPQPVRLHCVLTVSMYVVKAIRQQCLNFVKTLFKGFCFIDPSLRSDRSEQTTTHGDWRGTSRLPLLHLASVKACESFCLRSVHNEHLIGTEVPTDKSSKPSTDTPAQLLSKKPDPFVNPMWLHDVWGLKATVVMKCVEDLEPTTTEQMPKA